MDHFFVPYFFIALVSDPLITKTEYSFKLESFRDKQLDNTLSECTNITANFYCQVVRPEAIRCNINSLTIGTNSIKSAGGTIEHFGERITQWECDDVHRFCEPFEIIFNSTGVESMVMSDRLKNLRISTVSEIANLMNVKWVDAVSKQDTIQENTMNGECSSRILLESFNNKTFMESRFESKITLKSFGNIKDVYKKLRDVESCSRGKVKVSDNVYVSLASLEHSTVSSVYSIESCINKILVFTTNGGKIQHKYCISVDKVKLMTDSELPDITDPVSVSFLSV